MCTAITFDGRDFYFGRTLDTEYSFGEEIVFTKRSFPFFKSGASGRYAIIGMAKLFCGYPLFFDGMNEEGLCMAALNYVGYAHYSEGEESEDALPPYKLIPFILSRCRNLSEAKAELGKINLINKSPSADLPVSELHFIIADKSGAVTIEPDCDGVKIYENHLGVLSNNPPFPFHLENLNLYLNLSAKEEENRFSKRLSLKPTSRGLSSRGLPGDPSSPSRFIRACFYKFNTPPLECPESECISRIFHVLGGTEQIAGSVIAKDGLVKTTYTACMNANTGIYYYKTYRGSRINAVSMLLEDPKGEGLLTFPLVTEEDILLENKKI
jgi:choloylglycine hydrolase